MTKSKKSNVVKMTSPATKRHAEGAKLLTLLRVRLSDLRRDVDRIKGIDRRMQELGFPMPVLLPPLPDVGDCISELMEQHYAAAMEVGQ